MSYKIDHQPVLTAYLATKHRTHYSKQQ